MTELPDDPRFTAAIDLLRRTGMREFQIRYSDDEQPVVWMAVASYSGRDGRPVASGKINAHKVGAALNPVAAIFALCDQVIDGSMCAHCGRPAGFVKDLEATILDAYVCWYQWDPETAKFMRGCEAADVRR